LGMDCMHLYLRRASDSKDPTVKNDSTEPTSDAKEPTVKVAKEPTSTDPTVKVWFRPIFRVWNLLKAWFHPILQV